MMDEFKNYNPNFREVVCRNIKKYRKEKNIRLMDLAEMLEVSPEYLKRIEAPNDTRKNCSLKLLYKISIIFDKKIDDFFIDDTKKNWFLLF